MHTKIIDVRGLMAIIAGTVLALAVPARAANFSVSPMAVTLGRGERSQTIDMTNQDSVPLRFELKAYRWDQQSDGQMILTPTDDIIFFPRLFDLPPHQAQKIRVGIIAPAIDREATYRLVMHQLKSFEAPRPVVNLQRTTVVEVLTNLRIPVFVEPPAPRAEANITSMALNNGTLRFTVKDSGNTHFRINTLQVEGFGNGTQPVFSKTAQGWYVLAGGSRNYELALPASECAQSKRLNLLVETDHGKLRSELPIAATDCARN